MKTQITIIEKFDSYADAKKWVHETGIPAWRCRFTIIDDNDNPIGDITEWAREVRNRDKYYMMSDDHRVFTAGETKLKRLRKMREVLVTKYKGKYPEEIWECENNLKL